MLQRIQTVYLLIITALMVAVLFLPLATLQTADAFYLFNAMGVSTVAAEPVLVYPAWAMFALTAVVALLSVVAVFLYGNRMLQIRLCVFNAILMVCFYGLFAFFMWKVKDAMMAQMGVKFALALPAVSFILDILAIRNIGADEMLVRSLNRLR